VEIFEKPLTVFIYIAVGLMVAVWPIIVRWQEVSGADRRWGQQASWFQAFHADTWVRGCFWGLGAGLGFLAGWTLPWWVEPTSIGSSLGRRLSYVAIAVITLLMLAQELRAGENPRLRHALTGSIVIAAIAVAGVAIFSTGILASDPTVLYATWHHWGVYIGPSELMLSGARIFYDFPAQYGLGPTLLIASTCGGSCWLTMYYVAAGATYLFTLLVLYVVVSSPIKSSAGLAAAVLLTVLACVFWTGYPPLLASPLMAPSVSGLRFLPAIVLVTVQLAIERRPVLARHWAGLGHLAFAVGALWSPESLFCVTFVWGPYYCWRRCAEVERHRTLGLFTRSILTVVAILLAVVMIFLLAYRLQYGVLPSAPAYLAYILYPPGPMPMNPSGPVWFTIAVLGLGFLGCYRLLREHGDTEQLRRHMLVTLLAYSALSYCLGRSHDNNFVNLAPFDVMVLATVMTSRLSGFWRMVCVGLMVSILSWSSAFNWGIWNRAITMQKIFEFDPRRLVASFSYDDPETLYGLAGLCARPAACDPLAIPSILRYVRERSSEPVSVLDDRFLLLPRFSPRPWSALDDAANYYFVPSEWRRTFLRNTAQRLGRNGWLIVHKNVPAVWIEDYQTAYDVIQDFDLGFYRALHLTPKRQDGVSGEPILTAPHVQ
jgi:hypothetical protein